jgi:hypothetical protein
MNVVVAKMITSKRSHDVRDRRQETQDTGANAGLLEKDSHPSRSKIGLDSGRDGKPGFRRTHSVQIGVNQRPSRPAAPPPPIVRSTARHSFAPLELHSLSRGTRSSRADKDAAEFPGAAAANVTSKTKAWKTTISVPSTSTDHETKEHTLREPQSSLAAPMMSPSLPLSPSDTNRSPSPIAAPDRKPLRPMRPIRKYSCGTPQRKAGKGDDGVAPVAIAESESDPAIDRTVTDTTAPSVSSIGLQNVGVGDDKEGRESGAVTNETEDNDYSDRISFGTLCPGAVPTTATFDSFPCAARPLPLAIFRQDSSTYTVPSWVDVVSVRDDVPLTAQDYAALADFVLLEYDGPDGLTCAQKAECILRLAIASDDQQGSEKTQIQNEKGELSASASVEGLCERLLHQYERPW